MHRHYFFGIVVIALISLLLIFFSLWREIELPDIKEPSIQPPASPYKSYISGVGIVEARSGNIMIGTPLNRLVEKVLVKVGDKVKKGDILVRLEDRDLQANLLAEEAAYKSAQAKLQKMEALPRSEDLISATGALNNAKAMLDFAKNQNEMVKALPDPRAISQEERDRRLFNYQQAQAKWEQAQAAVDKIKGGTWKPDLLIASYEVVQAEANVNRVLAEIQQTIIQSPAEGTILQVKIHAGELTQSDSSRMPMLIMGDIDEMYLRVSINQLDIPYFNSSTPAVAFLQDNAAVKFPLEFVRVEPFLVGKQNLTNEITEKIDTRVLQILYRIKNDKQHPIYVGQQMDVFIEAKHPS